MGDRNAFVGDNVHALPARGGGGTMDGMEGERIAKLEAVMPHLATKADLAEAKLQIIGSMVALAALSLTAMTFIIGHTAPPLAQAPPIVFQMPPAAAASLPTK